MAVAAESQVYDPLPNLKAIRLLRITPGLPEEEISCTIEVYDSPETSPAYECLSYVWGNPEDSRSMKLNGNDKGVGVNLYDALVRLRPRPWQTADAAVLRDTQTIDQNARGQSAENLPDDDDDDDETREPSDLKFIDLSHCGISKGLVWIDAISINQDDITERGHQVANMGSVYRQARQVIIWLGVEDKHVPGALEIMRTVCNPEKPHGTIKPAPSLVGAIPGSNQQAWLDFMQFVSNAWFSRVWVLQEYFLAKKATFFIGRYAIDQSVLEHEDFEWLLNDLVQDETEDFPRAGIGFVAMFLFRKAMNSRDRRDVSLLRRYPSAFEASDPRDKVYALLSFVGFEDASSIPDALKPDYTKSAFEVYRDATRYTIEADKSLAVLRFHAGWSEQWPASWVLKMEHPTAPWWATEFKTVSADQFQTAHQVSDDANELIVHGYRVVSIVTSFKVTAKPSAKTFLCEIWSQIMAAGYNGNPSGEIIDALATYCEAKVKTKKDQDLEGLRSDLERHETAIFSEECDQRLPDTLQSKMERLIRRREAWCFSCTADGRLSVTELLVKPGDEVVTLIGADGLQVLRPERDYFRYVGRCVKAGYMYGERVKRAQESGEEAVQYRLH